MKLRTAFLFSILACTHSHAQYIHKGWCNYDYQITTWHLGSRDKRQHFVAGMIAGSTGYGLAKLCKSKNPMLWAFIFSFTAGLAKEWYDLRCGNGTAERADVLWTGLGASVCFSYSVKW